MQTKKLFLVFALLIVFSMIADRLLFVIFPFYLIAKDFSATEIGLIFSIASFILLLSRTFIGMLSDLFGRKLIMSLGLLLQSLSISLFPAVTTLFHFSLLRGLQEVSNTLTTSVKDALIADLFGRRIRARIISKLGTVFPWSRALGAIVGFLVVTYLSLHHGFYVAALVLFISFLMFSIFIKEKKRRISKTEMLTFKLSLKKYSKPFLLIAVTGALQGLTFTAAYFPAFFILAKTLEIKENLLFILLLINYMISGFFAWWSGRWIDKVGRVRTFILSMLAFSSFTIFYAFSTNIVQFFFVMLGVSLAFYLYWIAFKTVLMDFTDRKYRGEQIGFAGTLEGIGSMVGPILGGFLVDFISLSSAFFVAGLIGIFASSFIYFSKILHL